MENVLIFVQQQYLLFGGLAVLIYLFMRHESVKGGRKLSCAQVVQSINSDSAIVLDVRETKEFDGGHIVDSVNLPHGKIAESIKVIEKYRQKQIIVADAVGQHSAAVVKTLTAEGFDVVRLGGGVSEWQHENLPLVKT